MLINVKNELPPLNVTVLVNHHGKGRYCNLIKRKRFFRKTLIWQDRDSGEYIKLSDATEWSKTWIYHPSETDSELAEILMEKLKDKADKAE